MNIIKEQNIVCFGPTNSGKSTLAGYLYSRKLTNEEYEKKVQQFREEYGDSFQERNTLSYFVDTGKDEYRLQKKNAPGTSKRKHIVGVQIETDMECTVIDTPGQDKRWRNGFQGIYLGDIGIFVVEINSLLEISKKYIEGSYEYKKHLNRLLIPVALWEKYGRLDRLIIAISKMDLCDYSRYSLQRAEDILKGEEILKNIPIVPMAINVKQRSDINVFSESERFSQHPCLVSVIKRVMEQATSIDVPLDQKRLFASIDKKFEKTRKTGEPALRIKVLDGNIKVGGSAIIGPVKYNEHVCSLTGSVRSLLYEANRRPVDMLAKGHIGGVIFSRLQVGRDVLDLADISLLNTSVVMDAGSEYESGNFLVFSIEINSVSRDFFANYNLNTDVKLIWFGKIVVLRIISFVEKTDRYQLCLMNTKVDNYPFYFLKDSEGNILYKDYVLQYKKELLQKEEKKSKYEEKIKVPEYEEKFLRASLKTAITITDDSRKDVTVYLKEDYEERLNHKGIGEAYYIETNNTTVLSIHNISGIELADILFHRDIDKTDIIEVAVKAE